MAYGWTTLATPPTLVITVVGLLAKALCRQSVKTDRLSERR